MKANPVLPVCVRKPDTAELARAKQAASLAFLAMADAMIRGDTEAADAAAIRFEKASNVLKGHPRNG